MFKPSNYTWSWQDLIPSVDLAPAWREVNKSQGNLSLAPYKPSVVIWMLKNHCDNWKTGHSLESLWCFWLNFGKTKTTPGQIPTSKKKKACRCDHRVGVLLRQESQEKKKTQNSFSMEIAAPKIPLWSPAGSTAQSRLMVYITSVDFLCRRSASDAEMIWDYRWLWRRVAETQLKFPKRRR